MFLTLQPRLARSADAAPAPWIEWAVACSALDPGCVFALSLQFHQDELGPALPPANAAIPTDPNHPTTFAP